jgi:hypothetical protein
MATDKSFPKREAGRILALDVGEKRIGLAVSDPLGITAQGLEVWTRRTREGDLDHLLQVAELSGAADCRGPAPPHGWPSRRCGRRHHGVRQRTG